MRDHPNDPRILQNMAIAFSRTGRMNEAIGAIGARSSSTPSCRARTTGSPSSCIKRGDLAEAAAHLEAFLEAPPPAPKADRWVRHARQTLDELRAEPADLPDQPEG